MKFVERLRRLMTQELVVVCTNCLRPDNDEQGPSGDFAVCARCGAPVTSRDGVMVWQWRRT